MEESLITFVIRSYNSMSGHKNIRALLESIYQKPTNSEVIVVDNFSADSTKNECLDYPLIFIQKKCNRAEALMIGIRMSHTKYVMVVDTDMILSKGFIQECIEIITNNDPDGLAVVAKFSSRSSTSRFDCAYLHDLEYSTGIGDSSRTNILIFKKAIVENAIVPEDITLGEDYILINTMIKDSSKIYRIKRPIISYHDPSIQGMIERSLYYGKNLRIIPTEAGSTGGFLYSISILSPTRFRRLIDSLSNEPDRIVPFCAYVSLKYMAFLVGVLIK